MRRPFHDRRQIAEYARLSMTIVQGLTVLALTLAGGIIALLFYERTVPTELLMLESAIVAALGTTLTSPYRPEQAAATTTTSTQTPQGETTVETTTGEPQPAPRVADPITQKDKDSDAPE